MNKIIINSILLIILGALAAVLVLPIKISIEAINKYVPTYSKLNIVKEGVDSGLSKITSLESQIKSTITSLNNVLSNPIEKKYTKKEIGWELDIPNLLIYLETGAKACNVILDIQYLGESIAISTERPSIVVDESDDSTDNSTNKNTGTPSKETTKEPNKTPTKETIKDNESNKGQTNQSQKNPGLEDRIKGKDNPERETERTNETISKKSDFNNYTVPIVVVGSYSDILNYLKYCTNTPLVVPYSMHIKPDPGSNKVIAEIILRVLHLQ